MLWGLAAIIVSVLCCGVQGDSYLEAYAESHGNAPKSDRDFVDHYPSYEYGTQVVYGPPPPTYVLII